MKQANTLIFRFSISIFFLSAAIFPSLSFAQTGGTGTYQFLNMTNSARIAAMGGTMLAVKDNDICLALANPSLISKEMDRHLALSFVDYYSDINYGFAMFSSTIPTLGSYTTSIQFMNYGKFTRTDETGMITGTFTAADYAFNLGWGRQLDSNFSIGANLRAVTSSMENASSYGIGVDIAGSYTIPGKDFTVSLVARNIGRQLKPYENQSIEPFPLQVSIGLSKRLKHLPFRYSIVYNRLDKYKLDYDDPSEDKVDPLTNLPVKKSSTGEFFGNLGRHFILGGEFMPSQNLSLRVGYSYGRRQEMGVDTRMGTVGFSWGFGIRIKKFQFNYSRSTNHLSGSPNYVSLTADLSQFIPGTK